MAINSLKCLIRTSVFAVILVGYFTLHATAGDYNRRTSASRAYSLASKNVVKLIDIRRPSEWRRTGVGSGARKISMHQSGFVKKIDRLVGGDRTKPIALIYARGVRSSQMKAKLNALGFTNVLNVSEGMLGSKSGRGWIKRGLPTRK